jgi:hypothetical protein
VNVALARGPARWPQRGRWSDSIALHLLSRRFTAVSRESITRDS